MIIASTVYVWVFFTGTEVSENVIHCKKYLNSDGFKKKDAGIRAAVLGPICTQFSVKYS